MCQIKLELNSPKEANQRHKRILLALFDNQVKIVLYGIVSIVLILSSCKDQNKKNLSNPSIIKRDTTSSIAIFDSILNGLKKNYVVNINESNSQYLLNFYKKDEQSFRDDSIKYFHSVDLFYKCDSSILIYLVQKFKGDTGVCSWIYSRHPHRSNIKEWEFRFTNEEGATILIYDYLMNGRSESKGSITTSPDKIEKIISSITLYDCERLLKMKHIGLEELKEKFKQSFSLH